MHSCERCDRPLLSDDCPFCGKKRARGWMNAGSAASCGSPVAFHSDSVLMNCPAIASAETPAASRMPAKTRQRLLVVFAPGDVEPPTAAMLPASLATGSGR